MWVVPDKPKHKTLEQTNYPGSTKKSYQTDNNKKKITQTSYAG